VRLQPKDYILSSFRSCITWFLSVNKKQRKRRSTTTRCTLRCSLPFTQNEYSNVGDHSHRDSAFFLWTFRHNKNCNSFQRRWQGRRVCLRIRLTKLTNHLATKKARRKRYVVRQSELVLVVISLICRRLGVQAAIAVAATQVTPLDLTAFNGSVIN